MASLSVIVLTRDEAIHLPIALKSLASLGAKVFIVDSGSTDRTREIAERAGCTVVSHEFSNHARQLNWALDNLPIATDWVMRIDADEWLTKELCDELNAKLPTLPADVAGLLVKRRVYFWGRWIRHGGYYPIWLLRVWRKGQARSEDRAMDEHMIVSGRIERLQHDLVDENLKGMGFFIEKHNRYSDKEVEALLSARDGSTDARMGETALHKRFLKDRVYGRAPKFLRAWLYWCYRYFLRLGFLDGVPGAVFHFLQGFWYRLVVDAKLHEVEMTRRAQGQGVSNPVSDKVKPAE
jgi:glycosyltransferase involved in cell wall biosynthesis